MIKSDYIVKKDIDLIWHPYTQMKDCEIYPPIAIRKAKGLKLFDYNGNFYYDTISSWWSNVHGHAHPYIIKAIREQINELEHVLFAGFTHKPAVELAEKLMKIVPSNLSKVFFSDNGSTSVEVALKMSFQYWKNKGIDGKRSFLSLDRAYHGDTIGAMSVSGVDTYNKIFSGLLFKSFKAPAPYCYRCPVGKNRDNCKVECLNKVDEILDENHEKISAVIIEPLLLGAGGMIVYPREYLEGLFKITRKYNVHLILDEVATGFGRTGKMFACDHVNIAPDFMCLSKGITSGYLPLGATLTTDEIYDAFYDDYDSGKTFYHGHTYTANPIAARAACASIDLFDKEDSLKNARRINVALSHFLRKISKHRLVGDTRTIGVIGAIELVKNKKTKEPFSVKERIGFEIYNKGLSRKLILRPLGDIIYFFLPLCAGQEDMEYIFSSTEKILNEM